jgi:predicted dehydrogenase
MIATPDEQHAEDVRDALAKRPKAIVVEKPLATDGREGLGLLGEASRLGIGIVVDLPRRFHSGVRAVQRLIEAGELGSPVAATFVYSGAPAHSAVHMLDLFHTWWGEGWSAKVKGRHGNRALIELSRAGITVAATFIEMPAHAYYVFEMSVYCTNGKIELAHSPERLEVSMLAPHPLYPSFRVLVPEHTFAMEEEPLLLRTMEAVVGTIRSVAAMRAQLERETASQHFSAVVLDLLSDAPLAGKRVA